MVFFFLFVLDDASDCYSIRSEGSSDSSDNFIVLQAEHGDNHHDVLGLFKPKPSTTDVSADPLSDVAAEDLDEVAVEVCEDTPTTSDHSSAGGPPTMASFVSTRNREVAVVTMHINDLEFIQQSVGSTSSLRLQAGHLSCNECSAISHEEFQVNKFLGFVNEFVVDCVCYVTVQVRFEKSGLARS